MSSPGITAINSGPLIIRTYLNSSINNTYVSQQYDVPVSSNRLLITSTGGCLVPTDALVISSVTVSSLGASTIIASSIYSNVVSSLVGNFSTLAGPPASSWSDYLFWDNQLSPPSWQVGSTQIHLGSNAGSTSQGAFAVALGSQAGQSTQGANAIAIGYLAGVSSQHNNSIILNASGLAQNSVTQGSCYINPIRGSASTSNMLYYDFGTKEVIFGPVPTLENTETVDVVNQPVTGLTLKKDTIVYDKPTTVKTSGVAAKLDSFITLEPVDPVPYYRNTTAQQVYTFGPSVPNRWMAGGVSAPVIAYSNDGINWDALGNSVLTSYCRDMAWNGSMWVAVGDGTFTIAYSYDGITWTGVTTSIFTSGEGVAWNGSMWVAVGSGTFTIAYSYDGIHWTGVGSFTNMFIEGYDVAWNGLIWVAGGLGNLASPPSSYPLAYSYDGITWTASGGGLFSESNNVNAIAWNGLRWVVVGGSNANCASLNNNIASSTDGINWNAIAVNPSFSPGYTVAWDGIKFIGGGHNWQGATGCKTQIMLYSVNSFNWFNVSTGLNYYPPDASGNKAYVDSVAWNGTKWIGTINKATNSGTRTAVFSFLYSINGLDWISRSSALFFGQIDTLSFNNARPHSITFPANRIVAVGGSGANSILYSNDGINWLGAGNSMFVNGRGVAWNGLMWVAVGGGGANTMAYSYDGITWSGLNKFIFTTAGYGVAWSGSMWVAVGEGGTSIAYSYDGLFWTGAPNSTTLFSTRGTAVAWNGSMWVAVGSGTNTIAYSYDGINWTGLGVGIFTNEGKGVAWNGTMWVAVGDGSNAIAYSYDGINWIGLGVGSLSSPIPTKPFEIGNGVAWNGSMWVAVGDLYYIAYSYDGINWTGIFPAPFSTNAYGISWAGSRWVAVGNGTNCIAYSSNGITWSGLTLGASRFTTQGYGVAWNATLPNVDIQHPMIACGEGTNHTLAYSPDGIKWTGLGKTIFGDIPPFVTGKAYGTAWNGNIWVAVGQGTSTLAYSYDGVSWKGLNSVSSPPSPFAQAGYGVAWNGTVFVAVGTGTNSIAYSYDGINWTGVLSTPFTVGYGVAWDGTMWVAVGQGTPTGSSIAYSYDGFTWTPVILPSPPGTQQIFTIEGRGVTVGRGSASAKIWVAVGKGGNTILYSTNGITWTAATLNVTFSISGYGVAWNGNQFVAVGEGRGILYSSDGITWNNINNINTFTIGSFGIAYDVAAPAATRLLAFDNMPNIIGYSSDDGMSWKALPSTLSPFTTIGYDAAFGNSVWVAVGAGTNTIAYSSNGLSWTGIVSPPLTNFATAIAWNGTRFVAVGSGLSQIAYSAIGTAAWTGIAPTIFGASGTGHGVAYSPSLNRWVVVGNGTNTVAYSNDNGSTWTGLGTTVFASFGARGISWNSTQNRWVAIGTSGTGIIAYSSTALSGSWTNVVSPPFNTGFSVTNNGSVWIAGGSPILPSGTSSIARSTDGITWTGIPNTNSIFTSTMKVVWTGTRFVATGSGPYTIAYSDSNGENWVGVMPVYRGVAWNSKRWVAVGDGLSPILYSTDGVTWYDDTTPTSTNIFTTGYGVAGNPRVGAVVVDSQVVFDQNSINQSNRLDVVSDAYYNNGYTNFSATITAKDLQAL
jgi:hypothetical protein